MIDVRKVSQAVHTRKQLTLADGERILWHILDHVQYRESMRWFNMGMPLDKSILSTIKSLLNTYLDDPNV